MPRLLPAALANMLFLLTGLDVAAAQPATGAGGMAGRCDPAPPLEGLLQRNDGVERIINIQCDRLSIGNDSERVVEVAFRRGDAVELRFAGRWAGDTFTIETVRIGDAAAMGVAGPSRCRFYAEGDSFRFAMCFAQYEWDRQKRAVVVAFTAG